MCFLMHALPRACIASLVSLRTMFQLDRVAKSVANHNVTMYFLFIYIFFFCFVVFFPTNNRAHSLRN